jgi:hypothetical protein
MSGAPKYEAMDAGVPEQRRPNRIIDPETLRPAIRVVLRGNR